MGFENWDEEYDEWIQMPSRRIAPEGVHTKGTRNPPPVHRPPSSYAGSDISSIVSRGSIDVYGIPQEMKDIDRPQNRRLSTMDSGDSRMSLVYDAERGYDKRESIAEGLLGGRQNQSPGNDDNVGDNNDNNSKHLNKGGSGNFNSSRSAKKAGGGFSPGFGTIQEADEEGGDDDTNMDRKRESKGADNDNSTAFPTSSVPESKSRMSRASGGTKRTSIVMGKPTDILASINENVNGEEERLAPITLAAVMEKEEKKNPERKVKEKRKKDRRNREAGVDNNDGKDSLDNKAVESKRSVQMSRAKEIHIQESAPAIEPEVQTPAEEEDVDMFITHEKLLNSIGILVKVGSVSGTEKQKRQAAMGFAQFSMEEEGQWAIANYKDSLGIDTLVSLMSNDDITVQQHAVFAIGNIASSEVYRPKLLEAGVLEACAMMGTAKSCKLKVRRSCAFALANLAASPSSHSEFFPHVKHILTLADHSDAEVVKFTSLVIQNLASNEIMWPPLIEHGALGTLMNVLADPNALEASQLHAIAAIQSLSVDDNIKQLICEEGLIAEVMRSITRTQPRILAEMVATLSSLCKVQSTHPHVAQIAILKVLFALLNPQTSLDVHFHISEIIASLAENKANVKTIAEAKGVSYTIANIQSADEEIRQNGLKALANMAAASEVHYELVHSGVIGVIIPMLRSDKDFKSRLYAALFLSIMSENPKFLIDLSHPTLLQMLLFLTYQGGQVPVELIRYITLALSNISSCGASHKVLRTEIVHIGIKRFAALSRIKDKDTRSYFALLIANLSSVKANRQFLNDKLIFASLKPLLHITPYIHANGLMNNSINGDRMREEAMAIREVELKTTRFCLVFLHQIIESDSVRKIVTDRLAVPLVQVGFELEDEHDVLLLVSVLAAIALKDFAITTLLTHKKIRLAELLNRFMNSSLIQVARTSMVLISRMSELETVHKLLFSGPYRPLIMKALNSTDEIIEVSALRSLCNLSSNKGMAHFLNDLHLDASLSATLNSPFLQSRKYALITLGNHAGQDNARFVLEDTRVIEFFLSCTDSIEHDTVNGNKAAGGDKYKGSSLQLSSEAEERNSAVFCLGNALYHPINHKFFMTFGFKLLKRIFAAFENGGLAGQRSIWEALANVATTEYEHRLFGDSRVIAPIIKMGTYSCL